MTKRELVIQTMACLLCTTPDTTIGKIFNFCLAAKVDSDNSGKTSLEFVEELFANPKNFEQWLSDVIDSDDDYSVDEMIAMHDLPLKNPSTFINTFLQAIDDFDTQGLG